MTIVEILDIMIDKLKKSKKKQDETPQQIPLRINPIQKDVLPLAPKDNKDKDSDKKRVIIIDI